MEESEAVRTARDYVDRKKPRVKAQVKSPEISCQEYVDQLPDVVFSLDPSGRFTMVNSQAEIFFGSPAGAFLGQPIWNYATPEDKAVVTSLIDMPRDTVWDREAIFLDAEGRKKFVRIRCRPCLDNQGFVVGFQGILRDRTAKRELEKKVMAYHVSLRDSEQRYRDLVEQVPDIIFSLDAGGRFTFLNTPVEAYLGYTVPHMLGKQFSDYVAPEDKDLARTLTEVSPDSIWDEEMTVLDSGGERKWVRIRCKPSLSPDGEITGYEGVMRDRTVRRKLEEELRASKEELLAKMKIIDDLYGHIVQSEKSRAIAQHTAEVAHELRQPLTIIGGFARRMARQLETCHKLDPEYQRDCIQLMIREVQRLERILSTLIDYNRPEPVHPENVDPNSLIEQVMHLNEEQLREKDLNLELDLGDEIGEVTLDPTRFQHVIRNLVANAIEASPRGGVIRVETSAFVPSSKAQETGSLKSDTYFEMKIRNQGSTIPPDQIEKIFDPFFSTKDHGSGLGLTLSKKIVEEHRGSIGVKSDPLGTVFSVWIPLNPGAGDEADESDGERPLDPNEIEKQDGSRHHE